MTDKIDQRKEFVAMEPETDNIDQRIKSQMKRIAALTKPDPRFLKIAEGDLPCKCKRIAYWGHKVDCLSRYWPIYAQRLQEAFDAGYSEGKEPEI